MNYLIKPAVTLMNRLPLVYKFSLISILFLGPILVLAWLVISGLNQSVQTLDRGMDGLEELRTVENLLAASLRYRDYQAPGIVDDEPALLKQAEEAAAEVSDLLAELAAPQHSFDTSGSWQQQVQELQGEWQTLIGADNYQGSIDPQFRLYQEFVQKVLALIPATIEISGLTQSASGENRALLGLIRTTLPQARSDLGRARSYGIHALVGGQVGYNLSEILNGLYDGLTNRSSLLSPALTVAGEASPALAERSGSVMAAVDASLIEVRDALDTNIIMPMRLEMPWQEFDALVSDRMADFDALATDIFDVVRSNPKPAWTTKPPSEPC